MLFQTLDDKSECVGIYCDDKLVFDPDLFPEDLTATWKYCTYLKNLGNIEYANLYLQGSPLEAAIPEYLQDEIAKSYEYKRDFGDFSGSFWIEFLSSSIWYYDFRISETQFLNFWILLKDWISK